MESMTDMLFDVIWSSLWFSGFTLATIFNRRLYEWSGDKMAKRVKPGAYTFYSRKDWNVRQAFRITELMIKSTTVLLATFALDWALSLYRGITLMTNQQVPEMLRTMVNFYVQYLWPFITLGLAVIFIYASIKSHMFINPVVPISVANNTAKPLSVNLRRINIGTAEPGTTLHNTKLPSFYRNYLVEAIDPQGDVVYSKDFGRQELIEIDGKVELLP